MEARLPACVRLPLPDEDLKELVDKTKDYAIMHGAAMRSKSNFSPDSLTFAPFALFPSTFPKKEFEKAVEIQPVLNELMHNVAHDFDFLDECLKSAIEADDFTAKLFHIFETVRKEGISQPISLGLLRSDIMLESICCKDGEKVCCIPYCCWKQVEINTIAAGFGWLGPASSVIQRYSLLEAGHKEKIKSVPENAALEGLCSGMVEALTLFGKSGAVILFVVENVTYNICDQRFHEFYIRESYPDVKVIRRTLTDIGKVAKLDADKNLVIEGHMVGVVYFRSGYDPVQYFSDLEWDARLLIERSSAIKCPTIYYHLAGTKKVQQALAKPGVIEKYVPDIHKVTAVRQIFTGLYSLDLDKVGDDNVKMAICNPVKFVLKPQREGGMNNIYGNDVKTKLQDMGDSKERTAWILMERIVPPVQKSYIIRPGSEKLPELCDVVSELGIFGVIIGTKDKIFTNKQVGHMLRTKPSNADEGGVATGLGALDSPYLVDISSCSIGTCN